MIKSIDLPPPIYAIHHFFPSLAPTMGIWAHARASIAAVPVTLFSSRWHVCHVSRIYRAFCIRKKNNAPKRSVKESGEGTSLLWARVLLLSVRNEKKNKTPLLFHVASAPRDNESSRSRHHDTSWIYHGCVFSKSQSFEKIIEKIKTRTMEAGRRFFFLFALGKRGRDCTRWTDDRPAPRTKNGSPLFIALFSLPRNANGTRTPVTITKRARVQASSVRRARGRATHRETSDDRRLAHRGAVDDPEKRGRRRGSGSV